MQKINMLTLVEVGEDYLVFILLFLDLIER
ncbi:hypothetical protein CLV93_10693 [Prolixibacter denitrificans]|uniref:Uncharacterized protein n=1 Tax=Prolixibacter denitrificans TaxID=1541063 RepID=A0A2P8CBJ9_9BACT|nr:hypothetical protein CLV93_10693 [Prolixibacter denitrificans]